ncbi:alpha-N-acetylgalactosaminide alpha-2,6-sialyltransferase 6-like [Glandiceps talaboti]
MNLAPTIGYEADVGTKTTIRFVAHSAVNGLSIDEKLLDGIIVLWGPPNEMDSSGVVLSTVSKLAKENPNIPFYMLTKKQYEYVEHTFKIETTKDRITSGSWLTTGWFTMTLLRRICDHITLYGMVDANFCSNQTRSDVPYHYYEPEGATECSVYKEGENAVKHGHRYMTEKYVFSRWGMTTGNITFRYPSFPVENLHLNEKPPFLERAQAHLVNLLFN